MAPWVRYSIIRLGLFSVLFTIVLLLGVELWIAALVATVMAFSLSYIFFSRQRDILARDLAARVERAKHRDADTIAEDDATQSKGDSPSKS